MKKLFKNLFSSLFTSTVGAIAGIPEIITGVQTHDSVLIIKGIALVLLGFAANEKGAENGN